jgi:hypothetical protein
MCVTVDAPAQDVGTGVVAVGRTGFSVFHWFDLRGSRGPEVVLGAAPPTVFSRPRAVRHRPSEGATVRVSITSDATSMSTVILAAAFEDETGVAGRDHGATPSTVTVVAGQTSSISAKLRGTLIHTQFSAAGPAKVPVVSHRAHTTAGPFAPEFTASTRADSAMVGWPYDDAIGATDIPDQWCSLGSGALPAGIGLSPCPVALAGHPNSRPDVHAHCVCFKQLRHSGTDTDDNGYARAGRTGVRRAQMCDAEP